jgi:hypothetical protein
MPPVAWTVMKTHHGVEVGLFETLNERTILMTDVMLVNLIGDNDLTRRGVLTAAWIAIVLSGCSRENTSPTPSKEPVDQRSSPDSAFNGYIDLLAGTNPEKQGFRVNTKMQPIVIAGWAVDTVAGKPGEKMHFRVNGEPVECGYGVPRADVAEYLKNGAYTNSGYGCTVPTNLLKPGENIFEAVLTSRSAQIAGQRVIVNVTQ